MEGLSRRKAYVKHHQTKMPQQHTKLFPSTWQAQVALQQAVSLEDLIDHWKIISICEKL